MPFLPLNKKEMLERGWEAPDIVCVTGDAYVDHPSFGIAIISRVLEAAGFKVCILSQPPKTRRCIYFSAYYPILSRNPELVNRKSSFSAKYSRRNLLWKL